ncbi:MAG: hypothetical protein AB1726_11655 [Planctomycetota bacterium]
MISIHQRFSPLPSSPVRQALAAALALLAGPALAAAQGVEPFPLSPDTNDEWKVHTVEAERPGSDWNHFDMKVAETTIRAILPNYLSGDPVNIEEMNRFNKHLVADTVLKSTGEIATWLQNGTLVAVEFDVLASDPFDPPPPDQHMGTIGQIEGENLLGQYGVLGTMYCYDQEDYNNRIAYLVLMMGREPNRPTVWLGDTLQSGASGSTSMRLSGATNTVVGSVHSNGDLRLSGTGYIMLQKITFVGLFLTQPGAGNLLGPVVQAPSKALPSPAHDAAWYLAAATANGTFFAGDLSILDDGAGGLASATGVALSGVVYATGAITIESSSLTGTVTLVAGGTIDLAGSNCLLGAAVDDLLLWSTSTIATDAVALDGSGCVLTGAAYAPGVEFRVGGSTNQLTGRILASKVKVTGSLNTFTDGTK